MGYYEILLTIGAIVSVVAVYTIFRRLNSLRMQTKQNFIIIILICIIEMIIISSIINLLFDEQLTTLSNFTAIVVEIGVGMIIAIIVWKKSSIDNEKLEKIMIDIKEIVNDGKKLRNKKEKSYKKTKYGIYSYFLSVFKNLKNNNDDEFFEMQIQRVNNSIEMYTQKLERHYEFQTEDDYLELNKFLIDINQVIRYIQNHKLEDASKIIQKNIQFCIKFMKQNVAQQQLEQQINDFIPMDESFGGQVGLVISLINGESLHCIYCNSLAKKEDWCGYNHSDGYSDKNGDKWWLAIICKQCNYQTSAWKLFGRDDETKYNIPRY